MPRTDFPRIRSSGEEIRRISARRREGRCLQRRGRETEGSFGEGRGGLRYRVVEGFASPTAVW